MKELIEICEELGLDLGRAKRKHAILEIMRKENVTAEEVNEAREDIKERREREEAEKKERREPPRNADDESLRASFIAREFVVAPRSLKCSNQGSRCLKFEFRRMVAKR